MKEMTSVASAMMTDEEKAEIEKEAAAAAAAASGQTTPAGPAGITETAHVPAPTAPQNLDPLNIPADGTPPLPAPFPFHSGT